MVPHPLVQKVLQDLLMTSIQRVPKEFRVGLIRQRSYTVLEPSPQLIAHLEVQSLSKALERINYQRDEQKFSHKGRPKIKTLSVQNTTPLLKSSIDDPGTRVRELYEKVQKQQSMQMATLMEKQKREQKLLRQVFEEQNTLLYKQLKSICPKQPIEAKEAWVEKSQQEDIDRGPVSLSQLINHKASQSDELNTTSSTLTDTGTYIGQCETISMKDKDTPNNFKKSFSKVKPKTVTHIEASQHFASNSLGKIMDNSLQGKSSHFHINQHNSGSEREYEDVILTDRTSDTMADLNFTLAVMTVTLLSVMILVYPMMPPVKMNRISAIQIREAATKIVAYAKGYLVRRLMHTERVQSTVQTIRDALVCALQLHTDQAGIRGADIDLHRRLIQQITAACYNLHETFVLSDPAERCAIISSDRARKHALANRPPRRNSARTP
ncbi:Centriolar coiled-coil protein of 110 kDa [Eumeta japonica]|uniref:Centriolar coiled-coil protein of 110 kDa n=1 Tax=Eumeta variegata TaxID=151549 RepID=A0A4C1SN66_EUMVA|nr:Centriolar coiled-coil protein of 110 kDa [Eumeta japonica]